MGKKGFEEKQMQKYGRADLCGGWSPVVGWCR